MSLNQYGFSECSFCSRLVRYYVLVHVASTHSAFVFSGAVDSVIYTTTRKLIKPISFPNHTRTFSSDNSSMRTSVILSRKPSSIKRVDMCGDKAYRKHSGSATYSGPSQVRKADASQDGGASAIRVTLDRIQEVF